jgi:hypothetical protein
MTWLAEIMSLLCTHGAGLGVLGAAVAFIWSVWQFFDVRRRDFKNREFETYHRLIKELVQPDKDVGTFLDRQIAIVFELRHFDRYREVSVRMLKGLKGHWSSDVPKNKRLLDEIDLTLGYLEGRTK